MGFRINVYSFSSGLYFSKFVLKINLKLKRQTLPTVTDKKNTYHRGCSDFRYTLPVL